MNTDTTVTKSATATDSLLHLDTPSKGSDLSLEEVLALEAT
ncbi:MAG: hypothetical protein ACTSUO_01595 [Candidatus Thorarchaeota archaeon]